MELIFRKYFWTVQAAFLLLLTFLAARMVNVFVEGALSPLPGAQTVHTAPKPVAVTTANPTLNLGKFASLIGLPLPPPEPAVTEPTQAQYDPNAAPVKTSLRVRLLGTLLSSLPEWSIASIQDLNTQRTQTFMTHELIQGAEILAIDRDRVIIINNGRREYIDNDAGTGVPAPAFTPPMMRTTATAEPGTMVNGAGIKQLDDNNYVVPRAEIDKTLSNLNDVAMQARIVPAFKDGQAQGFKLFSIRPDSIYSKIGVQNGDVIKRINGFDLNSPEKALEVYSKLKEASRIEIEIERNGAPVRKTYNVR